MDFAYVILTPFVWLLELFYSFFNSYGLALVLFTLVVKLILFPFSLKGKRSMIQMNMLNGKMQKLQKQYAKNPQKYNEEINKLYEKEGVNPMGGCLWSLLPLFILIPLYAIIRQPLKYMMGVVGAETDAMLQQIALAVDWDSLAVTMGWMKPDAVTKAMEAAAEAGTAYVTSFTNVGYNQLYLSSLITPQNLEAVKTAVASVGTPAKELFSINFQFLGIDLAAVPRPNFWVNGISWGSIGLFLIPLVSAGITVLMSLVMNKTNNLNGEQNEQVAKTNRTMMLISPVMYLFFGFSMPAALSIYLLMSSLLGIGQEFICGKLLKKDYEKAAEEAKRRAEEEKEEEKRLRRERAERKAREAEEARKNKGKKKIAAADDGEKVSPEVREASRVGIRQYARGRAYDPDRFGGVTPYHEDVAAGLIRQAEESREEETAPEALPAEDAAGSQAPVETAAPVEEDPAKAVEEELEAAQEELDAELSQDDGPKED